MKRDKLSLSTGTQIRPFENLSLAFTPSSHKAEGCMEGSGPALRERFQSLPEALRSMQRLDAQYHDKDMHGREADKDAVSGRV